MTNATRSSLARGLGWFSIGLGLAEVLVPDQIARMIGVPRKEGLIRLLGLREIASGIGILTQDKPTGAVWSRVGGDMIDLGLLGSALTSVNANTAKVTAAAAAVAGVTALDVLCGQQLSKSDTTVNPNPHIDTCVTINRSADELYAIWRRFDDLPRFMRHVEAVHVLDDKRSHWVAKGPAGSTVEWDAEITEDVPGERIAWSSVQGSTVSNCGSVQFEPAHGGRGTVVRVAITYRPPGGALGATVARLLGQAPEKQVPVDLRRFKQFMETGEFATTDGQSAGRSSSTSRRYDDLVRK